MLDPLRGAALSCGTANPGCEPDFYPAQPAKPAMVAHPSSSCHLDPLPELLLSNQIADSLYITYAGTSQWYSIKLI
jgi:hypothetical protein